MLFALAVLLLIIAIVGGVAVHPVLFVLALLAIASFVGGTRHRAVP